MYDIYIIIYYSIFNEIKSSFNSLYTELEDVINLSGSLNERGGSSKYITPIAIYDPNNINNVIDFSSGKFDFKGGEVDIRKDLHVRGNITSSGVISGSNNIFSRFLHNLQLIALYEPINLNPF